MLLFTLVILVKKYSSSYFVWLDGFCFYRGKGVMVTDFIF